VVHKRPIGCVCVCVCVCVCECEGETLRGKKIEHANKLYDEPSDVK
jgi:hypothetical protein